MPFRSQDQWRWAFANKKPFADRWAKETETPFRALPKKKASTGGNFSARAGEQITGNRCRDENGHFAPCDEVQGEVDPTSSMAAWNEAMERQRLISNEEKKLRKRKILEEMGLATPKKGGGISAAERKRQQREEQKKNEGATHAEVGPGAQLGLELSKFADPDSPGLLNNLTANKLAEYGLVEMGRMGNPYITAEGRAYLSAARSGDKFAAREAFQRAREAYQAKLEQEQAQAEEQQFQQVIEQMEGSPRERRLRLAQERYEKLMNPKQPKAPKAPKAPNDNVSYGSGRVTAGSPKSTVKSMNEDENMYYPPKHVLDVMVRGALLANRFNLQDNFLYYAEKAFNGNPFTINDIKQMHQLHTIRESYKSNDDYGLAYMIRYQLIGGPAGFHWMDSIVQTVDSIMRVKEVSAEDRTPSLSASAEAIRGLDLQHHFKRGGTPAALKLSRKIANRDALSDDEIRQMHKYLVDNENAKRDGDVSNPSTSHIEWQMHGSDEGLKWSRDAVARLLNETYKEEKIDMIPSQSAASTAMRGLDLHHYFKRGGSPELLSLARKLANKKELEPEDVRKMHTYLRAHENSKRDGNPAKPSDSYITWMLHGGEDGLKWANDRIDRLRMSRTKPEYKSSDINFSPPDGVRAAAKRGLELRSKFNRGGTAVGIARARDLSNGKNMSPQTIRRMNSFFRLYIGNHVVHLLDLFSKVKNPTTSHFL